ncbi:hypothetical protein Bca52824_056369 [Brassica carinata]|uniref:Uncharacterized protein n=1 Tax=Brassica carinata TaxID=52824 RepID=A0A8X7QNP6_BRACI|nr:hypothetical protein Bca52824_056369 [Brassica carinata]
MESFGETASSPARFPSTIETLKPNSKKRKLLRFLIQLQIQSGSALGSMQQTGCCRSSSLMSSIDWIFTDSAPKPEVIPQESHQESHASTGTTSFLYVVLS